MTLRNRFSDRRPSQAVAELPVGIEVNHETVVPFSDVPAASGIFRAVTIDTLPLAKENLMDHEYIPVGPLLPLASLIADRPAR